MYKSISLENYGPLTHLSCPQLAPINLIIGNNDSGKTFLLKILYTAIRTLEVYKRGNEPRSSAEILKDKLHWTFQADKIGDLVTKGSDKRLSFEACLNNGQKFSYNFGKETEKQIHLDDDTVSPRQSNSIFLPPKEVLSLHKIILKSREQDRIFGFDDTYVDLVKALSLPLKKENNNQFDSSRQRLEKILKGKIEYEEREERWQFKKGNKKFPIGITAEGIKKIAILDTLLGNGYLSPESIIFIDEPESALHPAAISELLEIIALLAQTGMQFFLASHSYFVIKKLYLIAQRQRQRQSIPSIILTNNACQISDLLDEMPENDIINESIRLYEQEVELAFS